MQRIPVLRFGDVLLVSIQTDLQDDAALALQDDLAAQIVATGAKGVLIDITGLDIVDSFVGRMLSTIASISGLLDTETIVVGMRPAVAITLIELGLSLGGVRTALDLERGLRLLSPRLLDDARDAEAERDGPEREGAGRDGVDHAHAAEGDAHRRRASTSRSGGG